MHCNNGVCICGAGDIAGERNACRVSGDRQRMSARKRDTCAGYEICAHGDYWARGVCDCDTRVSGDSGNRASATRARANVLPAGRGLHPDSVSIVCE